MIDTDKYDNEGIELSDGGTICFPENYGRIQRIDKDGNTMEVRYQTNNEGQEWYELFDTRKDLLAEVVRLKHELVDATDNMNWLDELAERKEREVKMLWQYVDTEQMYNDGLLTVEGEMKND